MQRLQGKTPHTLAHVAYRLAGPLRGGRYRQTRRGRPCDRKRSTFESEHLACRATGMQSHQRSEVASFDCQPSRVHCEQWTRTVCRSCRQAVRIANRSCGGPCWKLCRRRALAVLAALR
eukprot:4624085-Prymnesium_polylepis.1